MDPLSDVLSLVKPRSYASGGLTAGGRWALDFPEHEGIKCYVVTKGDVWFVVEGVADPVHVQTGEFLMLPHRQPFRMCSDVKAPARDARAWLAATPLCNGVRACAPGDELFMLGGHFALEGNADLLLDVLPPHVHLKKESDRAALRGCVERMIEEMRSPQPGGSLIAQQSAYTMLVLALRLCLAEGERGGIGWLFALADAHIAAAITSMHEQPSHNWTVQSLAEKVGVSRTTFAERFRRTVGSTPIEYLTRWRMMLARDRLMSSRSSISEIAQAVGYESESAFSAAFKREMGSSPREYSRRS